jgi:hypothetical protein
MRHVKLVACRIARARHMTFLGLLAITSCSSDDGDRDSAAAGAGGSGEPTTTNVYVDIIRPGDGCLPRVLPVDETPGSDSYGQVPCQVIEATMGVDACSCDTPGRESVDTTFRNASLAALEESELCGGTSGQSCEAVCLCEITQLSGSDLSACQLDADPPDLVGFCYVDEALDFVNPELVVDCPSTARRRLRFLDPTGQIPRDGGVLLIGCVGIST